MSINSISPYTPLATVFSGYRASHVSPTATSGLPPQTDSVSISQEGRAALIEAKSQDLDEKNANGNLTVGLFGEVPTFGVDVVYIPPKIMQSMPQLDTSSEAVAARKAAWQKIENGQQLSAEEKAMLQPDHDAEFNEVKSQWKLYKSILTKYGVDYKDSQAFTAFMRDAALRDAVEKEFELRL